MAQKSKDNDKLAIQPLGDHIVVKPAAREEKTASGIIIPDTVKGEKPERGTVVAAGPGKWDEDGEKRIPISVKVGDLVVFSNGYGDVNEVKLSGQEYYILSEEKVLAIINEK